MAVAIVLILTTAADAQQQVRLIFGGPAPQAELTAPQINAIPGTTAARLEQARALAAAGNWDEAVDIYTELAADNSDRVVALDDGRYVSLRTYCQLQLTRMPAEALAAYRRRVDPLAERWYRDGVANRDEQLLERLLKETFCSSWGDDALLALGELALERGDHDAARRDWEQISPLLRDPDGQSLWQALRGVDLNARWPEIERHGRSRNDSPNWLAYPDTQLDLADVRARLMLASIRAGELDRAALELDVFRRWHPNSVGQLGGQQGPYVVALEKLLASAREWNPEPPTPDWPTYAGAQSRSPNAMPLGPTLVPAWERPIPLSPPIFARRLAQQQTRQRAFDFVGQVEEVPKVSARETGRPLSCFPVVSDGVVLFADATGIHAANLATGKPAIMTDGLIFHIAAPEIEGNENAVRYGGAGIAHGAPRLTLNVIDHVAFGRIGPLATAHPERRSEISADRIIGLDLRREGLLTLRIPPGEAAWSFDGTPVSNGRHLFVAMRRSGATPNAYVACFDTATSQRLWRTNIGSADTPAGSLGDEVTHNLLTLVGDRIYFNTNLGLVAALDADSGEICWLAKYPRLTGQKFAPGNALPLHFDRDPSPAIYHEGLVIVAPADTPDILAFDADTGKTVWVNNQLADGLQLLGVVAQKLVVSGNRLASVDVYTGKIEWIWPESASAGIRGMGRGVIAGSEVFWPTRTEIYAIDPASGARTRSPISLSPVSDCGANLAAADGCLIVAGYDKLQCFGSPTPPKSQINKPKQTDPSATGG